MPRHLPLLLSSALLVLLAGCIDEKCDPGFERIRGSCFPSMVEVRAPDRDAGMGDDGSADPGDDDDACPRGEGFGVECTGEADCTCGTQCLPVLSICSVLNCHEYDEEVCPEDWECRDISDVTTDPSVTSICLAPS